MSTPLDDPAALVLPTYADVQDAAERLSGFARITPLLRSNALDVAVGGRVFVKAECLQRTGSFKFRGAYNRLSRLTAEERLAGVVAYSSGNHGRGVAAAASVVGVEAVIVMPSDAPEAKIAGTRALGAQVVLYDRQTESREAIAEGLAKERGAALVPPFDDFHVIAGQGTVGLEIAQQMQDFDLTAGVLIAPTSGGGLISGIGLALTALCPETRLYAVEPALYDDHAESLAAGYPVEIRPEETTICDALMSLRPGDLTFALNQQQLAGAMTVSDDEVLAAMAFAFQNLKIVLEPSGAVGLALLLSGRIEPDDSATVVVASGGNVDPDTFARALATL